ncbi:tumor necrosis factor ligand superfamily member 10-like isoform X2 [Echeneis naucrates]|uniref:tumor necrosis factor ligand superfamily member 10-like isoform X2 n=1 Tax=Echeneis naucrates TaxID=173247 RepID=UPI001113E89D|nr:tumor necrosis factor ligand superfamily member 10-like isoform X2 [Echeneis naucrates]
MNNKLKQGKALVLQVGPASASSSWGGKKWSSQPSSIVPGLEVRGGEGRRSVVMTGSGPKLGLLLLLAVLLQTVVVTITVLHFTTALSSMKETFARSSVSCLTGADLQRVTAVRGDPCWQVTQQLHLLIEKSLSQRYQRQISSAVRGEASPRPKVAAHVTGSFVPKLDQDGGVSAGRRVQGQKISWWEGQKGLAFLQDVQLVDGELVVPQPGLYYVYAQTYFRHTHSLGEESEEAEDRGRPLLQYVYKKVSSYPVPILLMKTSRTSCWSRGSQFSLHSAHQGGLFPLSAGDRLFVTVTNASAVDMDEKSSFFGAFLIS